MRYGYSYRDLQKQKQRRRRVSRGNTPRRPLGPRHPLVAGLVVGAALLLLGVWTHWHGPEELRQSDPEMVAMAEQAQASATESSEKAIAVPSDQQQTSLSAPDSGVYEKHEIIEGPLHGPFLPPELERDTVRMRVGAGDTLSGLMDKAGIYPPDVHKILTALKKETSVHNVPQGARLELTFDGNKQPLAFAYEPVPLQRYVGALKDGQWSAKREDVELDVREYGLAGVIEDSLIGSVQRTGERSELGLALASLFAWQIDFARETRAGDAYRLIVEKRYREGKFWDYGRVLAAQFTNQGRIHQAYCIEVEERVRCFEEDGRSTRRAFLRSPVNFTRISSRFQKRRYHPVLGMFRAHHGVDYAASTGTPIWSVADGVVSSAGRNGGYGNMVVVRHPNGYTTAYAHLSRFARGIRKGRRIEQKQVIGYVGSTGLATGPHLHFELRRHGRYVDPLKADLPRGKPVPDSLRGEFFAFRDVMRERLRRIDAVAKAEPIKDQSSGT